MHSNIYEHILLYHILSCIYIYIHTDKYIYIYIYIHAYTLYAFCTLYQLFMYMNVYVHVHVYVFLYMCFCICVCLCLCLCVFMNIYRSRVTLSYLCSEVHVSIFKRTHFLLKWWEGGTPFVVFLRFVPWDLELLQIWKITLLQSWLS